MMLIRKDRCLELGLPEPKSYQTNLSYVMAAVISGHVLNSRICDYIGVRNLHSVISSKKAKRYNFTKTLGLAFCPASNVIPPYPVDIVYMTDEQRSAYYAKRKPAKV